MNEMNFFTLNGFIQYKSTTAEFIPFAFNVSYALIDSCKVIPAPTKTTLSLFDFLGTLKSPTGNFSFGL